MSGAHYEGVIERDGTHVRVIVDLTGDAMYNDADELAEATAATATRLLGQIRSARDSSVPF